MQKFQDSGAGEQVFFVMAIFPLSKEVLQKSSSVSIHVEWSHDIPRSTKNGPMLGMREAAAKVFAFENKGQLQGEGCFFGFAQAGFHPIAAAGVKKVIPK